MPEGNDPYGTFAFGQQLSKELRCAASSLKARQLEQQIPVDTSTAYIVTNPLSHEDAVIYVKNTSVGRTAAIRATDSLAAARPASTSAASVASGSVRSYQSSVVPPSTQRSSVRLSRDQEALEQRLRNLESTLEQEREGRLTVQAELARLQQLLEKQLVAKQHSAPRRK